jgi:hypothetical protein
MAVGYALGRIPSGGDRDGSNIPNCVAGIEAVLEGALIAGDGYSGGAGSGGASCVLLIAADGYRARGRGCRGSRIWFHHHHQSSQAVHAATPLLSCFIGGIDDRPAVLKRALFARSRSARPPHFLRFSTVNPISGLPRSALHTPSPHPSTRIPKHLLAVIPSHPNRAPSARGVRVDGQRLA